MWRSRSRGRWRCAPATEADRTRPYRAPLAAADVCRQGELGDHEHAAAHLHHTAVHGFPIAGKDPEAQDLVRHPFELPGVVVRIQAEEDEKAAVDTANDFAIDTDAGFRDPLQQSAELRVATVNLAHGRGTVVDR